MTVGTPQGRQLESGTTGAKSETTGVPTAAARCAGPVMPVTTATAPSTTPASSDRDVEPARSMTADRRSPAMKAVEVRSDALPVTATPHPSSTSRLTRDRARTASHPRAGTDAPGCTTTYGWGNGRHA